MYAPVAEAGTMLNDSSRLNVLYNVSGGAGWPPTPTHAPPPRSYNWPVLCFFLIVVMAIAGNILVCLAVKMERKLQNMFNFFLVSLALSDMLSAILVMPLSIVKALIEELPLPKLMCVAWYSLDVLFTSSTIIHLCMISIDRYMSLKYPLKYGHAKKTKHTILKIVLVWIISFCIAGPLFLFSMFDTQKNVYYKGCGPETTTFVLSATITSFYLPLLIMTIMYILTVRALHEQRKAQRKLAVTNSASSTLSLREESAYNFKRLSKSTQGSFGNGDVSSGTGNNRSNHLGDSLHPASSGLGGRSPLLPRREYAGNGSGGTGNNAVPSGTMAVSARKAQDMAALGYERSDMYLCVETTYDRGLTPSSTCGELHHLQELEHIQEAASGGSGGGSQNHRDGSRKAKVRTFKFRRGDNSNSSSKRTNLDKGRRAVQVLGIMFAMFLVFYLPFFATYVINATCMVCRPYISPHVMVAFEWLGYSGSMVNPIIYHVFNPDFRRSFQKLLRCRCRHAPSSGST